MKYFGYTHVTFNVVHLTPERSNKPKPVDAFAHMMESRAELRYPDPLPNPLGRSDHQIKNDIWQLFTDMRIEFTAAQCLPTAAGQAATEATTFLGNLGTVLWELDPHREKMTMRNCEIPKLFD